MITKEAIYGEVLRVLQEELLFDGELDMDTSIKALGLDSIQLMQLLVYLEESFSFEFAEGSLIERMKDASLRELVECVDASLGSVPDTRPPSPATPPHPEPAS